MGCIQSGPAGLQFDGAAKTFEMFSEQSLACGHIKDDDKTLSSEWPMGGDSHAFCKGWGTSKEKPVIIRYSTGGEVPSELQKNLDGASITVSGQNGLTCLHAIVASWSPVEAPVACIKKATHGGESACVCFTPICHTVDVYLRIDGVQQKDGKVFNQSGLADPAVASGCPTGAFATLVSEYFSRKEREQHIFHIPFLATNGETATLFLGSRNYGSQFATLFASAIAKAGEGVHEVEIRFAPRAYFGDDVCDAYGACFGLSNCEVDTLDTAAKDFCIRELQGKQFSSSSTQQALSAAFHLTVEPSIVGGFASSTDMTAPEWTNGFKGDADDVCSSAMSLASGRPASVAAKELGMSSVGTPAHVVVPYTDDSPCGVGSTTSFDGSSDRRKEMRDFVTVLVFWRSDGGDDDFGVFVRFRMDRYTLKNFSQVANPQWELGQTFRALKLKNKHIDAAIPRDARVQA